jgi:hypothetical protein
MKIYSSLSSSIVTDSNEFPNTDIMITDSFAAFHQRQRANLHTEGLLSVNIKVLFLLVFKEGAKGTE